MLYPIEEINKRVNAGDGSREYVARQSLEFYVRLVAALAIDLAFRPEYDEVFISASQKAKRQAWEISVRYFIRCYKGSRTKVREALKDDLLEQYTNGMESEKKSEIEAALTRLWKDSTINSLFTSPRMMGMYLKLGEKLIEFLRNVINSNGTPLDGSVAAQLQDELAALNELRLKLKNITEIRNGDCHTFNGAAVEDAIDRLNKVDNAFLKAAKMIIVTDEMEPNAFRRIIKVMENNFESLSVAEEQLMRLQEGVSIQGNEERERTLKTGMNQIALAKGNQAVFLMRAGKDNSPRFHLLSPLFAFRRQSAGRNPDVAIFLDVVNSFGDCSYMLMHTESEVKRNTIQWIVDGSGGANTIEMEVVPSSDTAYFPMFKWPGVDWIAGRKGLLDPGTVTTGIAHTAGGGRYRINMKLDEPGKTYPDFLRCFPRQAETNSRPVAQVYSPEKLQRLTDMFTTKEEAPWKLSVWGTGGVGKTFTVLDALRKYLAEPDLDRRQERLNYDYIFFLTAKKRLIMYDGEDDLSASRKGKPAYPLSYYSDTRSALQRLYCCLTDGQQAPEDSTIDALITMIVYTINKNKVLLILDDVDSVQGESEDNAQDQFLANAQEQNTLVDCMDRLHEGAALNRGLLRVIMTSRNRREVKDSLELPPMKPEQAVEFAEKYYRYYIKKELSDQYKELVKKYTKGTPAFIIRLVYLFKSRPSDYFENKENLDLLEQQILSFSLATTNLDVWSRYIMEILCQQGMEKLRLSLIKLILFDQPRDDIDKSIQALKDWHLIEEMHPSISLRSEANFLLDELDGTKGSLPKDNRRALKQLSEQAAGRSYQNSDVVDEIVCAVATELTKDNSDLSPAQQCKFVGRLEELIRPDGHGSRGLEMQEDCRKKVEACIEDVRHRYDPTGTTAGPVTETQVVTPAVVEDAAHAELRKLVTQAEELLLTENWTWRVGRDQLTTMLSKALLMQPFPEDQLFSRMWSVVKESLLGVSENLESPAVQRDVTQVFEQIKSCNARSKDENGMDYSVSIRRMEILIFGL